MSVWDKVDDEKLDWQVYTCFDVNNDSEKRQEMLLACGEGLTVWNAKNAAEQYYFRNVLKLVRLVLQAGSVEPVVYELDCEDNENEEECE